MDKYIKRTAEATIKAAIGRSPVVAVLGPRQCGKSTLAQHVLAARSGSIFLDLQSRADRQRLAEPELFFDHTREQLVCLDEIQLVPDFFSCLRHEIDLDRRPARFLILGSASRDLIRQSSESLAGRIEYCDLTPFLYSEIAEEQQLTTHWYRGGFPNSVLAASDADSLVWRDNFIRTFLERDIPALGFAIPIPIMENLWRLLAHYHGQILNYSKLAEAAQLSTQTLKKYLGILEQTYMIRTINPSFVNLRKRLVKAPKVYLRDSGILHSLLEIDSYADLLGHPVIGASWEGYAAEMIINQLPRWRPGFIRTSNGAEMDLVMQRGNRTLAFEFKASKSPKVSRGFHQLVSDLSPDMAAVVAPIEGSYPISPSAVAIGLLGLSEKLSEYSSLPKN